MSAQSFWFIGCGNMGGAMLRGWIDSGMDPAQFLVIDPGRPTVPDGVAQVDALPPSDQPETLLLAVKPQMLGAVAPALGGHLGPETTLLSILAGVEHATLTALFPQAGRIVRVMPNMPAAIRKGVLALNGTKSRDVTDLMARIGHAEWIADEAHFDAVTALSGSGPAFLYRFVTALAEGGAALGLPAEQAARLAIATVEGAAITVGASAESPAMLADKVAAPGGSTRDGLNVLDDGNALNRLIAETLAASTRRNAELAALARGSD
jgi:pyrroline-5-carboxylate reductase